MSSSRLDSILYRSNPFHKCNKSHLSKGLLHNNVLLPRHWGVIGNNQAGKFSIRKYRGTERNQRYQPWFVRLHGKCVNFHPWTWKFTQGASCSQQPPPQLTYSPRIFPHDRFIGRALFPPGDDDVSRNANL